MRNSFFLSDLAVWCSVILLWFCGRQKLYVNQVVAENGHASVLEFFLLTFERAGYGKSSDVLESLLHTYTFSLNSILSCPASNLSYTLWDCTDLNILVLSLLNLSSILNWFFLFFSLLSQILSNNYHADMIVTFQNWITVFQLLTLCNLAQL